MPFTRPGVELLLTIWVDHVLSPLGFATKIGAPRENDPALPQSYAKVRVISDVGRAYTELREEYNAGSGELERSRHIRRQGVVEVTIMKGDLYTAALELDASIGRDDVNRILETGGEDYLAAQDPPLSPLPLKIVIQRENNGAFTPETPETEGVLNQRVIVEYPFRYIYNSTTSDDQFVIEVTAQGSYN